MTLIGILQILVFFAIVVAMTKPVGTFMYRVFEGQRTFLHPVLGRSNVSFTASVAFGKTKSRRGFAIRRPSYR